MKKLIFFALLIVASFSMKAQTIKQDAKGNYIAVKATSGSAGTTSARPTGKTFTDTKGIIYPVMISKNGKLFVIRTSKTGNKYNQYLLL